MNATWLPTSDNNTETDTKEQNPFDQSFLTVSSVNPFSAPKIVSEGSNTNNTGLLVDVWGSNTSSYSYYDSNSINNDVYSVSDHQPTTSGEDSDDAFHPENSMTYQFEQQRPKEHSNSSQTQQQQYQYQAQFVNNSTKTSPRSKDSKKRARSFNKVPEDEEKRKKFLERNRLAALKCRQRKKQWLTNLQARVEYLANDNDQLQMETDALRKEILDLKTILVTHKECPQYNAELAANNTVMQPQPPVYHHNFSMNN